MGNSQFEEFEKLINHFSDKELVNSVLQLYRDASKEDRIALGKLLQLHITSCKEERKRQREIENKQAILNWKVREYETAPPAKKSGKPSMYHTWNVYVHAKENDLEVPETIKDRVDQYILAIAKKKIAEKKYYDEDFGNLRPEDVTEWRDLRIAGYMHELREANPETSIEELSFKALNYFEKERQKYIRELTEWNQLNNKTWSERKAALEATNRVNKHPLFRKERDTGTIGLDEGTIERIYRRIKKRNR